VNAPAKPPFFGAAYYPEDWPAATIDQDLPLMKKAGMNVMRMAEFAWSAMEPSPGRFEFGWLHDAVDKLGKAGIASVLCTPTATPPLWLTEKHPEVLYQWDNGKRIGHGGRRHYCPTTPVYREYIGKIVSRMAREFGAHPNVIGWQVDNEIDFYFRPCSCDHCRKRFHACLESKYGTIDALNAAWCTSLWSMTYQRFDQVPPPRDDIWHHPALRTSWAHFASDAYVDFIRFQAEVLRNNGAGQPIGTDMINGGHVDHFDLHQHLDIAQVNHYHMADNLWETAFWFDKARSYKERPFWNTETMTCWNGSCAANGYKAPGFCRANTWFAYALGGEAALYWLWRQHFAGQELMHGAVISSAGRPLHVFDEIAEIGAGLGAAGEFLAATTVDKTGLAIHFSDKAQALFEQQPMVNGLTYPGNSLLPRVYHPLMQAQFRMEVLQPAHSLDGMRLLISPFVPMLDDGGLRERLRAWIKAGGIWIAGPLTDVRDQSYAKYRHAPYGSLEEWAGFRSKFEIPGDPRQFKFRMGKSGAPQSGSVWYDAMEAVGCTVLARYIEGPMKGGAAIIERPMGKGRIVVLGTMPEPSAFVNLVRTCAKKAGIAPAASASRNLLCVPRSGNGLCGMVVVEHENKAGTLTLSKPAKDLISGKAHAQGTVKVKPYGVLVLKYGR